MRLQTLRSRATVEGSGKYLSLGTSDSWKGIVDKGTSPVNVACHFFIHLAVHRYFCLPIMKSGRLFRGH